jgi:hypothetical protein
MCDPAPNTRVVYHLHLSIVLQTAEAAVELGGDGGRAAAGSVRAGCGQRAPPARRAGPRPAPHFSFGRMHSKHNRAGAARNRRLNASKTERVSTTRERTTRVATPDALHSQSRTLGPHARRTGALRSATHDTRPRAHTTRERICTLPGTHHRTRRCAGRGQMLRSASGRRLRWCNEKPKWGGAIRCAAIRPRTKEQRARSPPGRWDRDAWFTSRRIASDGRSCSLRVSVSLSCAYGLWLRKGNALSRSWVGDEPRQAQRLRLGGLRLGWR